MFGVWVFFVGFFSYGSLAHLNLSPFNLAEIRTLALILSQLPAPNSILFSTQLLHGNSHQFLGLVSLGQRSYIYGANQDLGHLAGISLFIPALGLLQIGPA